jgi:hypothetical protein
VKRTRGQTEVFPRDPYLLAWERVTEAVLASDGSLPAYVRRAIARGEDPADLAPLLEKVRAQAYRIVDADVAGLDTDVVLEAVLAAALGSGEVRRRAALKALR